MNWKKIYKFICHVWILVPILSFVVLYVPMIWIGYKETPELSYNGFRLLLCNNLRGNLVNQAREVVVEKNPEFIFLKIFIASQVMFAVILIFTWLLEWKKKTWDREVFMLIRGIVSIGYILTALMIQEYVKICIANQNDCIKSIAYQHQNGLEPRANIIFSVGVVVLFMITALVAVMQTDWKKSRKFICYIWLFVPILSLARLSVPIIKVGTSACFTSIPEVPYNGFQLLVYNNLVNQAGEVVIGKSFELTFLKILIAAQMIFDITLIFSWLLEWRMKSKKRKIFLLIRGIISAGYVLTALGIYRYVQICIENQKNSFQSYANSQQVELEKNIIFSVGVVIFYIVTLVAFAKKGERANEEGKIKE